MKLFFLFVVSMISAVAPSAFAHTDGYYACTDSKAPDGYFLLTIRQPDLKVAGVEGFQKCVTEQNIGGTPYVGFCESLSLGGDYSWIWIRETDYDLTVGGNNPQAITVLTQYPQSSSPVAIACKH
jgi:hypothetical protein